VARTELSMAVLRVWDVRQGPLCADALDAVTFSLEWGRETTDGCS